MAFYSTVENTWLDWSGQTGIAAAVKILTAANQLHPAKVWSMVLNLEQIKYTTNMTETVTEHTYNI